MRSQTLMELKVCLFLQCHFSALHSSGRISSFFSTSWPLGCPRKTLSEIGMTREAMLQWYANISDGSYLPRPAESGGDMHHYAAMRFGQGELSVYHAALTRSKGNPWRKRCDLAANRKIRKVSFPTFPTVWFPRAVLVVSQSLGLGLVHHGRKPLKTSQNIWNPRSLATPVGCKAGWISFGYQCVGFLRRTWTLSSRASQLLLTMTPSSRCDKGSTA